MLKPAYLNSVTQKMRYSFIGALVLATPGHALEVVVDNNTPPFTEKIGSWSEAAAREEYGNSSEWTHANSNGGTSIRRYKFLPDLPAAGFYIVQSWNSRYCGRATDVLHRITHATGIDDIRVDQSCGPGGSIGEWLTLGTFSFDIGQSDYAEISNEGLDGSTGSYVGADAFQFVYDVDLNPPYRSNGLPGGELPAGTTSTTISLETNEDASCKFISDSPGTPYGAMPNTFSQTGGQLHSSDITELAPGDHHYQVRCRDTGGDTNSDDFLITFTIPSGEDITAPQILDRAPTGTLPSGTTAATLRLTTDEFAQCRFKPNSNDAFEAMTPFETTGTTDHQHSVAVEDGGNYTYYVKCRDGADNTTPDTEPEAIVFSVAEPGAGDPLDDEFEGSTLDPSWQVFNQNGNELAGEPVVEDGALKIRVTAADTVCEHWTNPCAWYQQEQGPAVYKTITGTNYKVTTQVLVKKASDPTVSVTEGTQLAGILLRKPNPSGDGASEDWVFNVTGSRFDVHSNEQKSTDDGASRIKPVAYEDGNAGDRELLICRIGNEFSGYHRPIGGSEWVRGRFQLPFDRPDMPDELELGLIAYTFATRDADIEAQFSYIRVERDITSESECKAD